MAKRAIIILYSPYHEINLKKKTQTLLKSCVFKMHFLDDEEL